MTINDKIRHEKVKHDINKETGSQVNLTNVNILRVKKHYHLIKVE